MKNIIGYRGMAKSFISINRLFYECDIQRLSEENQKLSEENKKLENLKKWLPIVERLEEEFKTYENAKSIDYKTYTHKIFATIDELKYTIKSLEIELNKKDKQ